MSSLLVFFFFFSKIGQDIYYVEQNVRGTWYLADFEDFPKIYDINAKKKKSCEKLHPQPCDDPVKESLYPKAFLTCF